MLDFTKPVTTRDGRAVRILCTDGQGRRPVVGFVEGDEYPSTWSKDGTFHPYAYWMERRNEPKAN